MKQVMNQEKPLIDFPCKFPIKVIGLMQDGFAQNIVATIKKIDSTFNASCIEMKPSKKMNYISLSVTVYVHNQLQLDDIYRALSGHELVKFVL
jgi:uncharacterized protein